MVAAFFDGEIVGLGELKYIKPSPESSAELSVTVEENHQSKGVGSKIFVQLATIARNRLIKLIFMKCLIDNTKVRSIAKKHGATFSNDSGEVDGWIKMPAADFFSLVDELLS